MSHMPPTGTPGGNAVNESRRVDTGTGLTGGGDLTVDRTIELTNTAVTPGSYTSTNLTVDAQGRITAASSGAGGGTVTGSGTTNKIAKFTGASAVGDGSITDDGLKVLSPLNTGIGDVASPFSKLDVAINADATTPQVIQTWRNNFGAQAFSTSLGVDAAKVMHFNVSSGNTAWRFNNSAGTQIVRLDMKAGNQALLVNGDTSINGKTILNADGGASGAAADIAGTNLRLDSDAGSANYVSFRTSDGSNSGLIFNNVTGGAADGYVIYENAALPGNRKLDFAVAGVQQVNITSATTAIHNSLAVDQNTVLGNDSTADTTTINGTAFLRRGAGAAALVIGDGTTKDFTFYLSGTSLRLFEYSPNFGTGGSDRLTVDSTGLTVANSTNSVGGYKLNSVAMATPPTFSSIAFSAPASTVNLSTLGDIDWIQTDWDQQAYEYAKQRDAVGASAGTVHRKLYANQIGLNLIDTLRATHGTTWPNHNAASIAGTTFSTTAADDAVGIALSTTTYSTFFTNTSAMVNFGWEFSIPSRPTAQVVRIYFSQFNTDVTVEASLSTSGTSASNVSTVGATQTNRLATFTVTGGLPGEVVKIRIRVTNNAGGNGSMSLSAIQIGTS